jgi:hypothetical protein
MRSQHERQPHRKDRVAQGINKRCQTAWARSDRSTAFTDHKSGLTGAIQLPGVVVKLTGVGRALNPDPLKRSRFDLDSEAETAEETQAETQQEPWIQVEIQEPEVKPALEEEKFSEPFEPEKLCHHKPAAAPAASATRECSAPKNCIPTMKGNNCSHAITQSQDGMMHQETHMLLMKHMCKDTPHVVAVNLTQLSMKAGLNEWGTDAEKAVTSKALKKNLSGCALEQIAPEPKNRFWSGTTSQRRMTQLQFEPRMLRSPFNCSLGIH